MAILRNNLWIWGQQPGCHHACDYNLPGVNLMDSAQGARDLGIPNCCRVVMLDKPTPPFDKEAEKLRDLKQVVWSAVGAGGVARNNNDQSDLSEVLRQAKMHSNVTGAVLDDFFPSVEGFQSDGKRARHSIESVRSMSESLHNFPGRPLDLWLVWYTYQLDYPISDYLELCDVITLWTWKGAELEALDENIAKLAAKTPGKRRLAGCYMWNYGEKKPLTIEEMQFQLDRYEDWINQGVLEGIVFCSNCIGDIGLDTVDLTRAWIKRVAV